HEEASHLRLRGVARHHAVEGERGLVLAQPLAQGELPEQRLEVAGRLAHAATLCAAARRRKLRSRSWPPSEAMLSGWNCTPCSGRSRWASPMMMPSSVSAVTARAAGKPARSTISE